MEEECSHKKKKISNKPNKKDLLREKVIEKMKSLGLWSEELVQEIPQSWDSFSNYVLISSQFFKDDRWHSVAEFWEFVSKTVFDDKYIALVGRIKNDSFRSPSARVMFGACPWVRCRDNGVVYLWHVERTMFCTGNASERHRIARLSCEGQVVVDMFAGIGYFTLPYLVRAGAARVLACEWNPVSVEALRRNLAANGVAERCDVREGDVASECPRGVADRVYLGLIPSCEHYWPVAARALRPRGGTLHVHGNVTSGLQGAAIHCQQCSLLLQKLRGNLTDESKFVDFTITKLDRFLGVEPQLDSEGSASSTILRQNKLEWYIWMIHVSHSFSEYLYNVSKTRWAVKPVFLHRVKSYAPHIDHLVVDIFCENLNAPL